MDNVLEQILAGFSLFIAVVLLAAAVLKTRAIANVERFLVDLLPRATWAIPGCNSRRLARAAAVTEGACGVALLVAPPDAVPAVSVASAALLAVLVVVAAASAARKVSCTCFGRSRRTAGAYEVWRAVLLFAAAATVARSAITIPGLDLSARSIEVTGLAAAAALATAVLGPLLLIGRGSPPPTLPAGDRSPGGRTRRVVLHGLGLGALSVGAAILGPLPKGSVELSCKERYDRCYGCDPVMNRCCIDCYVACASGTSGCTPGISCDGCWPPANLTWQHPPAIEPARGHPVGVAHLDDEAVAYFRDRSRRDTRALEADDSIRAYAEQQGGRTLEYWQLALGRIWCRPYMMTVDEVAKRLARPVSELQKIVDDTHAALGWGTGDAGRATPPAQKA